MPLGGRERTGLEHYWINMLACQVLKKLFPNIDKLVQTDQVTLTSDVSTPLSIQHYLAKCRGQATGLDGSPERFRNLKVAEELDMETQIQGLWLTGQDTLLCGQPLVQIAGVITALRMSGGWASSR